MASERRPAPYDVALAATLHDATGALAELIDRALPRLGRLYRHVAVVTSPPTAPRLVRQLTRAGVYAGTPPANARGPLYRLAVRRALATGTQHVHYLDFDRVIRWSVRRPRELAAVVRLGARHDVLLVGRTPKAHLSHHRPLYATEVVVNRLLTDRLGLVGRVDFLVPSFVLSRQAAATLLRRSRSREESVYGEWAAILSGLDQTPAYVECGGLDWETPDRHRRAVRRLGLPAWRRRQDTAGEWQLRIGMAAAIVRGFTQALARFPAGRPALRRLPPRTPG